VRPKGTKGVYRDQAASAQSRSLDFDTASPLNQRLLPQVFYAPVNGQLSEQFNLEENHAHTFLGLCTRLYTKLTAHTLCIYINRLLGKPDYLQIKSLAFPN
jgi:hypothetical protein